MSGWATALTRIWENWIWGQILHENCGLDSAKLQHLPICAWWTMELIWQEPSWHLQELRLGKAWAGPSCNSCWGMPALGLGHFRLGHRPAGMHKAWGWGWPSFGNFRESFVGPQLSLVSVRAGTWRSEVWPGQAGLDYCPHWHEKEPKWVQDSWARLQYLLANARTECESC